MAGIGFPHGRREQLAVDLQRWLADNTGTELGSFDAGFLLDFIGQTLGPHYYNQGVRDAQAVLAARMDELQSVLEQLEQAER